MFMAFRHYLQLLYWLWDRKVSRSRRWQSRSAFIFLQLLPRLSASWEAVHCRIKNPFHGQAHFLSVFSGVCGVEASCIHDFAEQVTARRPNSKPILFFVLSLTLCLPRRANIILESDGKYSLNEDGSELTIKDVTKLDEGDYQCIAKNKAGERKEEVSLNVFGKLENSVITVGAELKMRVYIWVIRKMSFPLGPHNLSI